MMPPIPDSIRSRLGADKTERRLVLEGHLSNRKIAQGFGPFALEHLVSIENVVAAGLFSCGLAGRGRKNMLDYRIEENRVLIQGLPQAFEGFRLLQLSDLHCDLDERIMQKVISLLPTIPHDAVVVTGDYHTKIYESPKRSLDAMLKLIPHLHPRRCAILGNHDFLSMVAPMEEAGLPFLLNEALPLEQEGSRLWICGIDDPHFFRTHDLQKALALVPEGEVSILLSHSPETYLEAEKAGYALMLSGHTHGGQLCLPGGFPLYRNAPGCRREHLAGAWRQGSLSGYTSRGSGTVGVRARFNCPPEITVHVLHSAETA